jgi:hypothetical protein
MQPFQTDAIQAYIHALAPRETGDDASLRTLVARAITQSTCIRLGNELEKLINLRIHGAVQGGGHQAGQRQCDFLLEQPGRVIYAEFKSNINLDTEKRRETIEKVNRMPQDPHLRARYPNQTIAPYLVSLRWLRTQDIPARYRASYAAAPLIGIASFLEMIGHPFDVFNSYEAYSAFLLSLANRLEPEA